jgi:hypothetical protein
MQRFLTLFALVVVSFVASGCTLLGAGIGAAIPRYENVDGANAGARLRVEADNGQDFEGTVTSTRGESLVLATPEGSYELPLDHLRRRAGTYASTGAAIGGVIDAVCVIASVITIGVALGANHGSIIGGNWSSWGGSGGW